MPSFAFPIPAGFSWLSSTYHPTADEIHQYARVIAAREGMPAESARSFEREAELQLWVWRNEIRQPPPRRRIRRKVA